MSRRYHDPYDDALEEREESRSYRTKNGLHIYCTASEFKELNKYIRQAQDDPYYEDCTLQEITEMMCDELGLGCTWGERPRPATVYYAEGEDKDDRYRPTQDEYDNM